MSPRPTQLYYFFRISSILRRLHVPPALVDRLAPLVIGSDVHVHGDGAECDIDRFHLTFPRRFLPHFVGSRYEPETIRWLESHLSPGGVAVDAGSHVGYVAIVMARCVGAQGQVFAIEPAVENVLQIVANVRRNDLCNVEILPVALSDHAGAARFNLNESSDSFGFYDHPNTATTATRIVPTVTLDDILNDIRPQRLDVIKVDVEGAELEVLAGMSQTIALHRDVKLLVEWFPAAYLKRGVAPDVLPRHLASLGYDVSLLDPSHGDYRSVEVVLEALQNGELPPAWYCNLAAQR